MHAYQQQQHQGHQSPEAIGTLEQISSSGINSNEQKFSKTLAEAPVVELGTEHHIHEMASEAREH